MGLLREGINEVIATTRQNAAPMGIICRGQKLRMVVFRSSHTAEMIEEEGWIVANFLYDPLIYVQTAFDDLPATAFVEERVEKRTFFRLANAEAWICFNAGVLKRTSETLLVGLESVREEVRSVSLHPVNRGFNSIVEATVHGTRYARTGDPDLAMLIEHHSAIVRKCGGPREYEALELLHQYLDYPECLAGNRSRRRMKGPG